MIDGGGIKFKWIVWQKRKIEHHGQADYVRRQGNKPLRFGTMTMFSCLLQRFQKLCLRLEVHRATIVEIITHTISFCIHLYMPILGTLIMDANTQTKISTKNFNFYYDFSQTSKQQLYVCHNSIFLSGNRKRPEFLDM